MSPTDRRKCNFKPLKIKQFRVSMPRDPLDQSRLRREMSDQYWNVNDAPGIYVCVALGWGPKSQTFDLIMVARVYILYTMHAWVFNLQNVIKIIDIHHPFVLTAWRLMPSIGYTHPGNFSHSPCTALKLHDLSQLIMLCSNFVGSDWILESIRFD